jgi:lipopolysaccharide/colanic/teichoic acid biosynthesis glycosyltransferase
VTAAAVKLPAPAATAQHRGEVPSVWTLVARGRHDHFWATHGVRVVRRGADPFAHAGVKAYLLIEDDQLVLCDPQRVTGLVSGRHSAAVRLHVIESDSRVYSERVIADRTGRLVKVERRYAPATPRETRVLMTDDPVIASLWRRAESRDAGLQAVRLAVGLHGHRAASCPGRIFDATDAAEADQCVRSLSGDRRDRDSAWAGSEPATETRQRWGRRVFDIVFSLGALLFTAPLYPLIMFAIWLEDGRPFFFAHTRQTTGGRNFACYKIRTMSRDADSRKTALAGRNVCDGPQFHIEDDPRLLRVGQLLRQLHLDELPQFLNVLRGDMSIIGPRPSPIEENQFCPAWRDARLSVKPGITGLWQVDRTRAPNADFQEWIRHDLEYVERQSPGLDALILYKTIEDICRRAAGHFPGNGSSRSRSGRRAA